MILPEINGKLVKNIRIGPSTGQKWMVDFENESRESSLAEVNSILDFVIRNNRELFAQ